MILEKVLAEREHAVSAAEAELQTLRERAERFPVELDAAVSRAVQDTTERLERERKYAVDLLQKEAAGEKNVLLSRIEAGTLSDDVFVLIDSIWAEHDNPTIRKQYQEILQGVRDRGGTVVEAPMEKETLEVVEDPRRGKNMFALGLLSYVYARDLDLLAEVVAETFGKKSQKIIDNAVTLASISLIKRISAEAPAL